VTASLLCTSGRAACISGCRIECGGAWHTHSSCVSSHMIVITLPSSDSTDFLFGSVTQPTPDDLRKAIRETRRLIKADKPFGVNITILPAIVPPDYAGYARAAIEEGERIILVIVQLEQSHNVLCTYLSRCQDIRNSGKQPCTIGQISQGSRGHCYPQMHHSAPCQIRREDGR
jgi:hypothetical protein